MKFFSVKKAAMLLLCIAVLTGCGQKNEVTLPEDLPIELEFASGVGGWASYLTLERDGSFSGFYYSADRGDCGEDYPNGTMYICDFSGRFSDIEKADEHSYSLTLAELNSKHEVGEEWIENEVKMIAISSRPYGVEDGDEYILYLPDTPMDALNEDFLSWWPGQYGSDAMPKTLEGYGLYNVKMGYGFFE